MNNKKQLEREFLQEDKRFERAKAKAGKHFRRAEACMIIMEDALDEMHRINREIKEAGNDG